MTDQEIAAIRAHWNHLRIRIRPDETVEAQRAPGAAWGVLYQPRDTHAHLVAIGLRSA